MALESTQPLTEMGTRNLLRGKGCPAHKTDNLNTIYELIIYKIWELRHLATLWGSMAHYRDSFTTPAPPDTDTVSDLK
jgi:hypothetical protein